MDAISASTEESNALPRDEKNYEIESLRTLAIVLVVFQHSFNYLTFWGPPWAETIRTFFSPGQAGVDIFLAISGYVIAKSLLPDLGSAETSLTAWRVMIAFWLKRIFRLWPTVLFWVFADIILAYAFNKSGAFGSLRENIIDGVAAIAQVANFHQAYCAQPNVCFDDLVFSLGPLWSLSLEVQFYFVFPVMFFLLLTFKRTYLLLPALTLIAVSQLFLTRPDGRLILYIRTDALCGGIIVYLISSWAGARMLRAPLASSGPLFKYTAITFLLVIILCISGRVISFNAGISAIVATVLVFIAQTEAGWFSFTSRFSLRRIVNWVAARSYSIYVTHCICIAGTREIWWRLSGGVQPTASSTLTFYVTWIVMLIAVSEFSWQMIEVPLRLKGRRIAHFWFGGHHQATPDPKRAEAITAV
jgi:peptidoglycan/LPS O-acetylase OafA/YrhL